MPPPYRILWTSASIAQQLATSETGKVAGSRDRTVSGSSLTVRYATLPLSAAGLSLLSLSGSRVLLGGRDGVPRVVYPGIYTRVCIPAYTTRVHIPAYTTRVHRPAYTTQGIPGGVLHPGYTRRGTTPRVKEAYTGWYREDTYIPRVGSMPPS